MAEHYTRNTTAVLHYCTPCNKKTMHRVYNKRIGACIETHVKTKEARPGKLEPEKGLFDGL